MKIYIGADHNGFRLKQSLVRFLKENNYDVEDEGDNHLDPDDDFPQFAGRVAAAVKASSDKDARGILLCGSGQGMAIAANRYKGIFAILAFSKKAAIESRQEDNANVLCLPARHLAEREMNAITIAWLETEFLAAPRYIRRLKRIDEL